MNIISNSNLHCEIGKKDAAQKVVLLMGARHPILRRTCTCWRAMYPYRPPEILLLMTACAETAFFVDVQVSILCVRDIIYIATQRIFISYYDTNFSFAAGTAVTAVNPGLCSWITASNRPFVTEVIRTHFP